MTLSMRHWVIFLQANWYFMIVNESIELDLINRWTLAHVYYLVVMACKIDDGNQTFTKDTHIYIYIYHLSEATVTSSEEEEKGMLLREESTREEELNQYFHFNIISTL